MNNDLKTTKDDQILSALLDRANQIATLPKPKNGPFTRQVISVKVGSNIASLVNKKAYTIEKQHYTFGEFLFRYMFLKTNGGWLYEEFSKEHTEKHILAHWILSYFRGIIHENISTHLLRLSYDIYTIENNCSHKVDIPRLLDKEAFWGYRYELLVATIFLEAGFEIEWSKANGGKIVEFEAKHVISNNACAVECKSRHSINSQKIETSLKSLQKEALDKNPKLPLIMFVDANLSPDEFNNIVYDSGKYNIEEKYSENECTVHIFITNILDRQNLGWPRLPFVHAFHGTNKIDEVSYLIQRFLQYPSHFDINQKLG